jgi:Domain of unknown function (DUF4407)
MKEKTSPAAYVHRGMGAPSRWNRFLWWLATAEEELIRDCMIDRNRYAIIGMSVMGTWLFATFAWTYFFSTVTPNLPIACFLGFFMGCIILSIDRALIKGITRSNKRKFIPLVFRGLLAVTIGVFMAQPALLYLFDKEIHVQTSLDNEHRKKEKRMRQDSVYQASRADLLRSKNELEQQLSTKYGEVSQARQIFIAETDGTGGSKRPGLKDVAKAKQDEYQKLDIEYQQMQGQLRPRLRMVDSSLHAIDVTVQKEQQAFEALLNDGFITRIEALNHLVKDNPAVAFRYYLLVALLMLIELMPVIAKTLLPTGSYDEKVRLREELEKETIQKDHDRELSVRQIYGEGALEQDSRFIKDFFATASRNQYENMRQYLSTWVDDGRSLDQVWYDVKKNMFTKQHN